MLLLSINSRLISLQQKDPEFKNYSLVSHEFALYFTMDNFRRGLHTYLGNGAKTNLGVCLTELKH